MYSTVSLRPARLPKSDLAHAGGLKISVRLGCQEILCTTVILVLAFVEGCVCAAVAATSVGIPQAPARKPQALPNPQAPSKTSQAKDPSQHIQLEIPRGDVPSTIS